MKLRMPKVRMEWVEHRVLPIFVIYLIVMVFIILNYVTYLMITGGV